MEILWDTVATEIKGEDQVEALALKNVKTEETQKLPVDGVFIAVGIVPVSRLLLGMDVCGECDPDACEGDHLNDLANRKLLELWRKER